MALWLVPSPGAFAAGEGSAGAAVRLVIVLSTVIGALLIGMLLYLFSQRSAQVQFKRETADPAGPSSEPAAGLASLAPALAKELGQLRPSQEQRDRIVRTVSDIVSKTVSEQTGIVRREMTERLNQLTEEKRRIEGALQRRYQETLSEKKQTVAVLESIAEGLVVINNKGEVVMMDPAAEKLLSVDQQDRIGKPLVENLEDEQLVSLMRGSTEEDREIVLNARQDSTKRILRASNAVITDEDGKTVGMVAVLSDVTRQRELEQLKSDFVSTVSHELRTPIVAMRHALLVLLDQVAGPLSQEQPKFLEIVQRNLERLNALINDLLDLSKLEAKKMQLHLETGPIGPVIQSVCDLLEPWARSKAITINKQVPEDLPETIFDPTRIAQVLTNLVGNAVKFTPKQGRVTVEVRRASRGHGIEVSVSDTGIGLAPEDMPRLFSRFQQVGERSSSDLGGTGLGLAIAKELVELHQGTIWAESDTKHGARFVFTLPLASPPA